MTAWIVVVTNGLFFGATATMDAVRGPQYLIVILGIQALCAVLHHINCRLYINELTSRILFLNLQNALLRQNPVTFRKHIIEMNIIQLHHCIQRLEFLNDSAVGDVERLARNLRRAEKWTGLFGYLVIALFMVAFVSLMLHIW